MSLAGSEFRPWSRWHTAGAAALAVALIAPVLTIPRRIPLTYNEGWNAYFAARAIDPATGPLYPTGGLVSNNYPPLSFYLVGTVGRMVGDPVVAGRVIALAALLATGILVAVIVRQGGGGKGWAAAAALVMLGYAVELAPQYVATNDPQWLAHAVMVAGVAVLLASGRSVVGVAAAAALTVAALFIKHNLLALPAAVTLWLLLVDRRAAVVWIAAGAVAAAGAVGLAYGAFGDAVIDSVVRHGRVYDPSRLWHGVWATVLLSPLLLIGLTLLRRPLSPVALLALLYAAIAVPFGIIQRGGEGVSYNAHFEALIALSIVAGLVLSDAAAVPVGARQIGPGALVAFALLPLAAFAPRTVATSIADLTTLDARTAAWGTIEARIAASPGPVACELLALCFWGGKGFAWDFFNEGQRLRLGAPIAPLARAIAQHRFGAIVLAHPPGFTTSDGERLPQPLPRLIDAAYAPAATAPGDTELLVPRTRSAP